MRGRVLCGSLSWVPAAGSDGSSSSKARRSLALTAQTRCSANLSDFGPRVRVVEADPLDSATLVALVRNQDAVVFALGLDTSGPTTFLSDTTRILVAAMQQAGVRRLVAITGVGAGQTLGHGGWWYDWIVYPLFTRHRYADKNRQEELIEGSGLDWTIVRPAPFAEKRADGPLQVHTSVRSDTTLRRVTRVEVADFVLDQLTSNRYVHEKPFIGHP